MKLTNKKNVINVVNVKIDCKNKMNQTGTANKD